MHGTTLESTEHETGGGPSPIRVMPARRPVAVRPDGKVVTAVRETGRMFALALESLRQLFIRGLPVGEFFDQCWFLARVTTLPLILVSIPFGMVIARCRGWRRCATPDRCDGGRRRPTTSCAGDLPTCARPSGSTDATTVGTCWPRPSLRARRPGRG